MKLVTIGTAFVDIKGFPDEIYEEGGRNPGTVMEFHGGVGRNIAEDIKRLGCDSVLISLVDGSALGKDVIEHLDKVGVITEYIEKTTGGMGTWMAIFNEKGDVVSSISKRPDMLPLTDILERRGDEIFSDSDGILIEMDMDERILRKAFEFSVKYSLPVYGVVSNMHIAKERLGYIRKCSCFVCNRQESGVLFGTEIKDGEGLKERLREYGISSMIVTMDKDGCVYADSLTGEMGHCESVKVNVVETTGAGDSFFAAVSAALTKGLSVEEACRFANMTASIVIQTGENVLTEDILNI